MLASHILQPTILKIEILNPICGTSELDKFRFGRRKTHIAFA